jgi:uracil-DNA glycosylase
MAQELPTAAPLIPARLTLLRLRLAASRCTACDLYKTGTQTVFGEGLETARAIFAGLPGRDSRAGLFVRDLSRIAPLLVI